MATIRDVARVAQVSPSTISLVLNRKGRVSDEVAAKVFGAVRQLNYEPPGVGRPRLGGRLANLKRKNQVAFLLELPTGGLNRAVVYHDVLMGSEGVLVAHGQSLLLRYISADSTQWLTSLSRKVDGIIYLGSDPLGESLRSVATDLPFVRVMGLVRPQASWDHVTYNNLSIAILAAGHLLQRGHRNCAFLYPGVANNAERGREFKRQIEEAGGTVRINPLATDEWMGRDPMKIISVVRWLLDATPRPTAMFVPTDSLVPMVHRALRLSGVEPGRDIDIVSCNNELPFIESLHPRPSGVVDIHARQIGANGAEQLLRRLDSPEGVKISMVLEPEMVYPIEHEISDWNTAETLSTVTS